MHTPSVVDIDDAVRRRVGNGREVDRRLGVVGAVEVDERADVEVGQDVAIGDDEGVLDTGGGGGEADRPRRVERFGLDGVVDRDVAAAVVGERRHGTARA